MLQTLCPKGRSAISAHQARYAAIKPQPHGGILQGTQRYKITQAEVTRYREDGNRMFRLTMMDFSSYNSAGEEVMAY